MVQIGESYLYETSMDSSAFWFNKAIENNYYDCLAHKFKAEISIQNGETESGIKDIIVSHILNRNDTNIFHTLKDLLMKSNKKYINWEFNPQIDVFIDDYGSNRCRIKKYDEWMPYVFCKSIWTFSPEYKSTMLNKFKSELPRLVEEEECIFNIYEGYKKIPSNSRTNDTIISKILDIYSNDLVAEFIFYEIILKENPEIIFQIKKEMINSIINYFIKYHIST